MVVIDPPFITREVWEKYAECAKMLLRQDGSGMYLVSTIDENEEMIKALTGCSKQVFRPSIPNLVYQYSFYANYEHEALQQKNAEIPDF
jgi:EEF1A lysine methyltransferase 1